MTAHSPGLTLYWGDNSEVEGWEFLRLHPATGNLVRQLLSSRFQPWLPHVRRVKAGCYAEGFGLTVTIDDCTSAEDAQNALDSLNHWLAEQPGSEHLLIAVGRQPSPFKQGFLIGEWDMRARRIQVGLGRMLTDEESAALWVVVDLEMEAMGRMPEAEWAELSANLNLR